MKTNVKLLSAIVLLASACTTGSMVTSSSYTDDVYFKPGDNPPVVASASPTSSIRQVKKPTVNLNSDVKKGEAAKIVDNYQLEQKSGKPQSDNYVYNNNSDTTYESDEEAKYLIDNYDDPEEISYTTRIRTFYNPYAYDPYWDSYYSPGWGFNWNIGFGGWGGGFYSGLYNPFYYGGWNSPWNYYGYGGYSPWGGYYGGGYYTGGFWGT